MKFLPVSLSMLALATAVSAQSHWHGQGNFQFSFDDSSLQEEMPYPFMTVDPQRVVVFPSPGMRVEITRGDVVTTFHGQPIPEDRIFCIGRTYQVVDESGAPMFAINFNDDGSVSRIWSYAGAAMPAGAMGRGPAPTPPAPPAVPAGVGESRTVMIGIDTSPLEDPKATELGVTPGTAILVHGPILGFPSAQERLRAGDVIVAVEGVSPVTPESLREAIRATEAGEEITLEILRQGQREAVSVRVEPVVTDAVGNVRRDTGQRGDPARAIRLYTENLNALRRLPGPDISDEQVREVNETLRRGLGLTHDANLFLVAPEGPGALSWETTTGEELFGRLDRQRDLLREYALSVGGPGKGWVTFDDSGHALVSRPGEMRLEVLLERSGDASEEISSIVRISPGLEELSERDLLARLSAVRKELERIEQELLRRGEATPAVDDE